MLPALRYGHHKPSPNRPLWTSLQKMEPNDQLYDPSIYGQTQQPHVHPAGSNIPQFSQFPSSMGTDPTTQYQYVNPQYSPNYYQSLSTSLPVDLTPAPAMMVDTKGVKELQYERRKEQNRSSQKKFREKKELRIKELQAELEKTRNSYQCLSREAGELRRNREQLEAEIERLVEENRRLRTSVESSPSSDLAWIPGHDDAGVQGSSSYPGNTSLTQQHRGR